MKNDTERHDTQDRHASTAIPHVNIHDPLSLNFNEKVIDAHYPSRYHVGHWMRILKCQYDQMWAVRTMDPLVDMLTSLEVTNILRRRT